jgi:FMN phosphatase YigB (HAD superfamily)
MKVKTFYQLNRMIKYADKIAADYDIISYDLFDTLLIRRVHFPDMLKAPVGRFIAAKAKDYGLFWKPEKVHQLRDKIEAAQRAKTGERFEDHEACYPDFMRDVLSHIFEDKMSDKLLQEVTDYELTIENAMLVTRAELVDWMRKQHQQGKTVLVISDMYLPSEHLKRLIEHAGFSDAVTHVVSSADTFKAKASGAAFPMLKEKFGLEPNRWLHIGDNPISDGVRPNEFGIRSLIIKDASEKTRKLVFRIYYGFALGNDFWKGRMFQQMMLPLENENQLRPSLYNEGYHFFAPLVGNYVQAIAERTRNLGIKKIFFMSREGWTFKKFWELAMPVVFPDGLPEIEYLYVSRMALAGPACAYQGLTQTNADIVFLAPGNRDFRDVCKVFNLDLQLLTPFLERYELRYDDPLSPFYSDESLKYYIRFIDILEDAEFQTEVKRQTRPSNDALQLYLEQIGFFDYPDVSLADVGWMGTIQRFLYDAVKHRDDKPRFHGFLMGASRGIPFPTRPDNYVEGLIFDYDRCNFAGSLMMNTKDIFEEAFRAPHSGLNGYQQTDDGFKLLFRNSDDETGRKELKQNEYFAPLKQGMFDAAPRFGAASAVMGYTSWMLKPWLNYLLFTKLAFPKTDEVSTLTYQSHLDDFHGKNQPSTQAFKPEKQLWNQSLSALRWNPFLRLNYYIGYAFKMLRR